MLLKAFIYCTFRPLTLAAFNGDSSVNAFSQPSALQQQQQTLQGNTKEENDYIMEQRKILETFEKKKQDGQIIQQQRNVVPNPLSPPAGKQSVSAFSTPQPVAQPTTNGAMSSTNSKPSDDLLMMGSSSAAIFQPTQQNSMTNNFTPFNGQSGYGRTIDANDALFHVTELTLKSFDVLFFIL